MSVNKKTFEVEVDGKKVEVAVLRPNHKVSAQGTLIYNKAFRTAVESGSFVKLKIEQVMREQNLWDDKKQSRYEELVKTLLGNERKLITGGIKMSDAVAAAIEMRRCRAELQYLNSERNELDALTAESQAEQARFNYYVSACTVFADTGKPYFKDVEDYLSREGDVVVLPAAQAMGKLLFDLDDSFREKLPENKFLLERGYCDKNLHLIRKSDGKRIDSEGRLVDDKGRLVNESGELIDRDGNLLTESGEYKVEFSPFLDDEGSPIVETVS